MIALCVESPRFHFKNQQVNAVKKIISFYCKYYMKHVIALWIFLMLKARRTYRNYCALNG
jgi:hypothetical protein